MFNQQQENPTKDAKTSVTLAMYVNTMRLLEIV